MIHEKIIKKDERGTLTIRVTLWTGSSYGNEPDRDGNPYRWDVIVLHKAPKKRLQTTNYSLATPEEILEAKMEFWNKIKPIK